MTTQKTILALLGVAALAGEPTSAAEKAPEDAEFIDRVRRTWNPRVIPAFEIPQFSQYYTWIITGNAGRYKMYKEKVPLYEYDFDRGRMIMRNETIPVGQEVSLVTVVPYRGRNYYAYDIADPNRPGKTTRRWIDGVYIIRDEKNSWSPAK